jgi:hypothetical protein
MKPFLVPELLRTWQLSLNPEKTEVIASRAGRTLLLKGGAAQKAHSGESLESMLPALGVASTGIAWEPEPVVLSDLPCEGSLSWSNSTELEHALATAGRHTYLICGRLLGPLFDGVAGGKWEVPLTPILIYGDHLLIGPTLRPGRAPCARCWKRRLLDNLPSLAERVRRRHELQSAVVDARAIIATARLLWEVPHPDRPPDFVLCIDLDSGGIERQRLFPLVACSCSGAMHTGEVEDIEGDLFGVVHSVGPSIAESPFAVVTAMASSTRRGVGAASAVDASVAKRRALFEAVERLAAVEPPAERVEPDSFSSLTHWMPFTQEQYANPGFPYVPLRSPSEVRWSPARRWLDGALCAAPTSLVTLYRSSEEVAFAPLSSTGIAAGRSPAAAAESAFLERIERDALTRAWYAGKMTRLDPARWAPTETRRLLERGYRVWLAHCIAPAPVPVVVAFVTRNGDEVGAIGSSAALSLAGAAPHAVEEAVLMYAHGLSNGSLAPLPPRLRGVQGHEQGAVSEYADMAALVSYYQPLIVDLSNRSTLAVGLHVASVWSPVAVDLPGPLRPLARARWIPDHSAEVAIAEEPLPGGMK